MKKSTRKFCLKTKQNMKDTQIHTLSRKPFSDSLKTPGQALVVQTNSISYLLATTFL